MSFLTCRGFHRCGCFFANTWEGEVVIHRYYYCSLNQRARSDTGSRIPAGSKTHAERRINKRLRKSQVCLIKAESGTFYLQSTNALSGRALAAAKPLDQASTDRSTAFGGGGGVRRASLSAWQGLARLESAQTRSWNHYNTQPMALLPQSGTYPVCFACFLIFLYLLT
jgi:hypothetical protein